MLKLMEEVGELAIYRKIGCYYYLKISDTYTDGIIYFYKGNIGIKKIEPLEKNNKLLWLEPSEIVDRMYFNIIIY